MPTASVNGIDLNYRVDGREGAPWLLFSNSLGTNLGMWDGQIEALAPHFRILRYDSRGHGASGAPDEDYTIELLGRDALGLLDHLEIGTTFYCGLSKGGMVGQWLGANAGERLEKLILSNTSSYMEPKEIWNERIAMARNQGMDALVDTVIQRWFTSGFIDGNPSEVARVREMILTSPSRGYAGCCAAIRDMDLRGILASIAVPALVIVGAEDPATPPAAGELIAESIPGARLHVIEDAAHLSNVEKPAQYLAAMSDFFGI
ncbi:MAG: 3-oxoadipate enol-lactonase [Hyphomicrobiales bacterium]